MPAPALTYDNLPPHSSLLREYSADGITITAAAREPDRYIRRRTRRRAAVSAGWISAGVLALCLVVFGGQAYANRYFMPWWTGALAGVFCAVLFVFIWQVRYAGLIDAIHRALDQNTILAVRGGRLLIESSGAMGSESWDVARDQVREIAVLKNFRRSRWGEEQPLDCLRIELGDERIIHILLGRDHAELVWISKILKEALRNVPV